MYGIISIAIILAVGLHQASAHAVFMVPEPRHDGDDKLKTHPCGDGNQLNQFYSGLSSLEVGMNEITFRETIKHNGSPYRIALSWGDDTHYDEMVLLDHLPHKDNGDTTSNTARRGVWHKVYVDIPDIECKASTKCALQLIQVMTDKIKTSCANPSGLETYCGSPGRVYFNCANIIVNGKMAPKDLAPIYKSWKNTTTKDPYVPNESAEWGKEGDYYVIQPKPQDVHVPVVLAKAGEDGSGVTTAASSTMTTGTQAVMACGFFHRPNLVMLFLCLFMYLIVV